MRFQAETLYMCPKHVIFGIVYFREIILETSQNVSETTPKAAAMTVWT